MKVDGKKEEETNTKPIKAHKTVESNQAKGEKTERQEEKSTK